MKSLNSTYPDFYISKLEERLETIPLDLISALPISSTGDSCDIKQPATNADNHTRIDAGIDSIKNEIKNFIDVDKDSRAIEIVSKKYHLKGEIPTLEQFLDEIDRYKNAKIYCTSVTTNHPELPRDIFEGPPL